MLNYYKAQLRRKNQVTLPGEVRELLGLNEGEDMAFYVQDGKVVVERLKVVPPDQSWFWTERWQKMEQEAQADINAGRVHSFDNVEDAIGWLNTDEDEDAVS